MSESDEDEELRRAIALSLEDSRANKNEELSYEGTRTKDVIDLVSSDEEDDLDAPVVAKPVRALHNPTAKAGRVEDLSTRVSKNLEKTILNGGSEQEGKLATLEKHPTVVESTAETSSGTTYGISGLSDRKKMEEERLERARKRKGQMEGVGSSSELSRKRKATSPPAEREARNGNQILTKSTVPSSASRTMGSSNSGALSSGFNLNNLSQTQNQRPPESSKTSNLNQTSGILSYRNQVTSLSGIQYPHGVVKKTWAYGSPRQGDDIKIEEVLQKNELEHAVLSAFQIEPDWIGGKMEDRTKVVWVLQAKGEGEVS
jgi:hypothetical protein